MIRQRLLLILLTILGVSLATIMLSVGPVGAQGPDGQGNTQSAEPDPSATPALQLTTAGWLQIGSPAAAADIAILALAPVDCAIMSSPVVGFEISRGQDPNDIADFINDLTVNGFSVGTVNISSGAIPSCVEVLIVQGSVRGFGLPSPYTAAEGTVLKAWTASGHGLMLSGEFGSFAAETQELFLAYGYSQQGTSAVSDPDLTDIDPLGPANSWVIYQADNFAGHPILNGVNALEFLASSSLSPNTNAIVTTDANANPATAPVMAAFTDGLGCVALSADSNWNSAVVVTGQTLDGYFKQDNAKVARQMVQWLNGCTSLKLSKVAAPNPVQAGGLLTYTLTAINDSVAAVTNVIITDTVPVSTSFVSATLPSTGPDANGVVTWTVGALNPSTQASVAMVVQVDSLALIGTVITNTAWVSSSQGLTDTATTFTPVNVQVVDPLITKAASTSQAQVGDVVTFTITVQQAAQSSSNATNVQVVDPLPNEVDILNVEVNAGFTTVAGRIVTWTIPVLTPTDIRLMTIRTSVNSASPPPLTIRNQANLSFDQGPARLSNQVEVFVPALAPTSIPTPIPIPTSTPSKNDDDDSSQPAPAPATPVPATAVSIAVPAAPVVLPVTVLPETGSRAVWPRPGWLILGLVLLLTVVVALKFNSGRKAK